MSSVRRRLLWTSIYGPCHLRPGEGGTVDAFETLMQEEIEPAASCVYSPLNQQVPASQVLRKPRRHFTMSARHRGPRAPEMLYQLNEWLQHRGGEFCTHGYRCIDEFKRSCAAQL